MPLLSIFQIFSKPTVAQTQAQSQTKLNTMVDNFCATYQTHEARKRLMPALQKLFAKGATLDATRFTNIVNRTQNSALALELLAAGAAADASTLTACINARFNEEPLALLLQTIVQRGAKPNEELIAKAMNQEYGLKIIDCLTTEDITYSEKTLNIAVRQKHSDLAEKIIAGGVKPTAATLQQAIFSHAPEMVKKIISSGVAPRSEDLTFAIQYAPTCTLTLLEAGVQPNEEALALAIYRGERDISFKIIDSGVPLTEDMMVQACYTPEFAIGLIERGGPVSAQMLVIAADYKQNDLVDKIVQKGVDFDAALCLAQLERKDRLTENLQIYRERYEGPKDAALIKQLRQQVTELTSRVQELETAGIKPITPLKAFKA